MTFDLQLFASVDINNDAIENGSVTGQSEATNYTVTIQPASASINVDDLSEELQAALANGSLTATLEDGSTVTINSDGSINNASDDLLGATLTLSAGGSSQDAVITTTTPTYLQSNNQNAQDGEYELFEADEEGNIAEDAVAFNITVSNGQITSVTQNGESVALDELPESLVTSAESTNAGNASIEEATTYAGTIQVGTSGTFNVAVDADRNLTVTRGSEDVTDGYTETGVTVGTYAITKENLESGTLKATIVTAGATLDDVTVTKNAGSATATFSNGITVNLAESDTNKVLSVTGAEFDSETGAITLAGVTYKYETNNASGTLTATATTPYNIGLDSGTGLDNVTYTVKDGDITLNFAATGVNVGASEVTAQLTTGTGYTLVDATKGTYTVDNVTYTATSKVDSTLALSVDKQTAGNQTSTETFKATSGEVVAHLEKIGSDVTLTSTDGKAWTPKDTTLTGKDDTFTLTFENGVLTAKGTHGAVQSDTAEYKAAVDPSKPETIIIKAPEIKDATQGTATATFSIASETTNIDYTLNMTYDADRKLTSATITGGDTPVVLSNGATSLKVGNNTYNVSVAAATFADDSISAGEIVVKGNYSNTLTDSAEGLDDKLEVTANTGSHMIVYQYDPKHLIAFNLGTDNSIVTVESGSTFNTGKGTINWDEGQALAYISTDGGKTWEFDKGAVATITAGESYSYKPFAAATSVPYGTVTLKADKSNNVVTSYTITPTTSTYTLGSANLLVNNAAGDATLNIANGLSTTGSNDKQGKISGTAGISISGGLQAGYDPVSFSLDFDAAPGQLSKTAAATEYASDTTYAANAKARLGEYWYGITAANPYHASDVWTSKTTIKVGSDSYEFLTNSVGMGHGGHFTDTTESAVLYFDGKDGVRFDSNGAKKDTQGFNEGDGGVSFSLETGTGVVRLVTANTDTYVYTLTNAKDLAEALDSNTYTSATAATDIYKAVSTFKDGFGSTSVIGTAGADTGKFQVVGATGSTKSITATALKNLATLAGGWFSAAGSDLSLAKGNSSIWSYDFNGNTIYEIESGTNKVVAILGTDATKKTAANGIYVEDGAIKLSADGSKGETATIKFGAGSDSVNATLTAAAATPTTIKINTADGNVTDVLSVYTNAAVKYDAQLSTSTGQDAANYVASRVSIDGSSNIQTTDGQIGEGTAVLSGLTAPDGTTLDDLYVTFSYNPAKQADANTRGEVFQMSGVSTKAGSTGSASLASGNNTITLVNGAGAKVENNVVVTNGSESLTYKVTFTGASTIGESGSTLALTAENVPIAVKAGTVTAPTEPPETYDFVDEANGYTFTVSSSDVKIVNAEVTSEEGDVVVELDESAGIATWSDGEYSYSAQFSDTGTTKVVDSEDTVVITKTALGKAAPAHYSAELTLGDVKYTVETAGTDTTGVQTLTYTTSDGESSTSVAGYTVTFNDNGTANDTSDDYFAYFSTNAADITTETATFGTATLIGTVGTVSATGTSTAAVTTFDNITYSYLLGTGSTPNSYTDAQGTTYTLVSNGEFTVVTGANGSSETLSADSTQITRTITGSKIGDVAVTITESGTSTSALSLTNIEGTGVTFDSAASTVTIDGTTYDIKAASSTSNYTAQAAAGAALSTDLSVVATTYTFSAAGKDYTVAIGTDNKVYNYADNKFGTEQSDVTVVGDVSYTFSFSDGKASAVGTLIGTTTQTYSTTNDLTQSSPEASFKDIAGNTVLISDMTDNVYRVTNDGTTYTYTYDETRNVVSISTSEAATIYTTAEGENEETVVQVGDTIITDDSGLYTATWTDADGNDQSYTTAASISTILAAVGDGVDSITLTQPNTGTAEVTGTPSSSFIASVATGTTFAIANNEATLPDGTTLTFTQDGGTYTSASASDGRNVTFDGTTLTLDGKDDAVLATLNDDGTWEIAEGVDNVTNSTDEPLSFKSADGDEGTLAPGASYNPESNTLVDGDSGKSLVKNEDGYASSDGNITGVENAAYDNNGNLVLTGAGEDAAVNGESLGVSGDDNYNATIPADGGNASVSGVDDGATVDLSKVDAVQAEDGATLNLTGDGQATINGDPISVSGDDDGVQVTTSDDGIESVAGLSDGATANVPEGTPVATDGSGTVTLNDTPLTISGDEDGVTLTPQEDGVLAVAGLDDGALLTAAEDATIAVGDSTYAVGPEASLRGSADGVSPYTAADQAFEDEVQDLINSGAISADTPVVRLSDSGVEATTDESGNTVYDLSDKDPGVFRLEDSDDDEPYSVVLPEDGGSTAIIPSDFSGEVSITGSDNGDTFVNQSADAVMNVTPGAGADKITTASSKDKINLANGGADTLDLTNGGILENYDPLAENAPAILTDANNQSGILDAIKNGNLELSEDGIEAGDQDISINNSGDGASDNRKLAKFLAEDGTSQLYAWNGGDGDLNSDGIDQPAVYVGNAAGNGSGGNISTDNDYEDTVVAGAGDVVDAGNGDTVELVDNGSDSNEGAKLETISSKSKNINVNGFHGGFGRGAHGFRGNGFNSFSFLDGVLRFVAGAVTFALNGWANSAAFNEKLDDEDVSTTSTDVADASNPGSGVLEYKVTGTDGNTTNNVAIAEDKTYNVDADYASGQLSFFGEKANGSSAVDFTSVNTDLSIDLSNGAANAVNNANTNFDFNNINNVIGGAGNTSLVGSTNGGDTLTAGNGANTIYSAAGNDIMSGYTGTEDKEASTFVFIENSGNDTLTNFAGGSDDNDDQINFYWSSLNNAELNNNGDLTVEIQSGEKLTIEDAQDKAIKANVYNNDWVAKYGKDSLTYDENVNWYAATGDVSTLKVATSDDVEVYMNNWDGSDGATYNGINIVDASSATGDVKIAGKNGESNAIVGGSGSNSLWGGFGGNDSLVGGSGNNRFFYLYGDGEDTISGANDGDTVDLFGINLSDIDLDATQENSQGGAISIKFKDGGSLTVQASSIGDLSGVSFKTANDGTWGRNSDGSWSRRS